MPRSQKDRESKIRRTKDPGSFRILDLAISFDLKILLEILDPALTILYILNLHKNPVVAYTLALFAVSFTEFSSDRRRRVGKLLNKKARKKSRLPNN